MSALSSAQLFAALGSDKRMQIVIWLHDPVLHFPTQIDGDLVDDGVCAGAIVNKLNVSQPTVASHMKILVNAQVVKTKRIKQWTFYKLNPEVLRQAQNVIAALV